MGPVLSLQFPRANLFTDGGENPVIFWCPGPCKRWSKKNYYKFKITFVPSDVKETSYLLIVMSPKDLN